MYSIVIVGGGVAAASVVYHLYSLPNFKGKVILLESGVLGEGVKQNFTLKNDENIDSLGEEETYKPWQSGSNVFDNPCRIKMIVTVFASTAKEFVRHHGMKGLSLYNKLASFGRDEQIRLAGVFLESIDNSDIKNYLTNNNTIPDSLGCIRLGSLMVCSEGEVEEFAEEFEILKKGGFEVEWWNKEKVEKLHGKVADFHAGIFFPKDGIIDSSTYSKRLIEFGKKNGLEVRENTHVNEVEEQSDGQTGNQGKMVKVVLESQEVIYANKVVMATGGLFLDKYLAGILRPCYSYLSVIKSNINYSSSKDDEIPLIENFKNSPNFFTFGFSHDWSMSQGYLRVSGEDHFSALKCPRMTLRTKNLENWALEKYPYLKKNFKIEDNKYMNGTYSETPDMIPLIGNVSDNSNIFYILGCNAWGQAILSGAAYIMPALIGERKLSKEEEEIAKFFSIRRFKTNSWLRPKF
jgi:glycine/D-amino acid oxidase-like deaminating enzyme